ncbi:thiol reductase thioredoxin [Actinomadura craniellae]|uniref:Thiol reductase thioredoxin n=1 Tax=Actinomadura craniellae TaxID=2231787 RepID=A0A365HAU0_9ACTN|nr:thioredoxin family protein [Actinomadura craniellae]RAY16046.1 thiol reductase thioredoxin [Actinomadura craniellae]
MATVTLTEKTFDAVAQGEGIVLVDFWATWCPPCRRFGPVFEKSSETHPDIVFGKIDTDAEQGLAQRFDVRSIPTVMAIRDGVIVYSEARALSPRALESVIERVRELDMEDVRKRLPS